MSSLIRGLLVTALTVPTLLAGAANAACDPNWEGYYQKGNRAGSRSACDHTCLTEKLYFYGRAVQLCPTSDRAHVHLADTREKLGQYPSAEKHYKEALRLNPERAEAHFGLADLAFDAGNFEEAVGYYQDGLRLQPDDALSLRQLEAARGFLEKGVFDSASIELLLGDRTEGDPIVIMGPGGVKEIRRLPLRIEFNTDQDTIRKQARPQLAEMGAALANMIESNPNVGFVIEGHTDARGSEHYNLVLSNRRASRVVDELVQGFGIPRERLAVRGLGEQKLRRLGDSKSDHQANRRVEVVRSELRRLAGSPQLHAANYQPPESPQVTLEAAVFFEDQESRPVKLQADATLHSGDGYRVYFRPREDQYLYVVQQDASNKLFPLFPNPAYGYSTNQVTAGDEYWVPKSEWLVLDDTTGSEVIYFIASSRRRYDIEDLLKHPAKAKPGSDQNTDSSYEILSMGVDPVPRPAKNKVRVAPPSGQVTEMTVDQLIGDGVDLVHRLTFRHE